MNSIDPIWWLALGVVLALTIGIAFLLRALHRMSLANALLEQRVVALQEQTQRDLLAMGQHVLAADKLLHRFEDRLGRLENTRPGETQYGQLETVLSKVAATESRDEISIAETELRSLLQQRTK